MSLRNSKRSSPDDDFYSALAAEAGEDQNSDVSDADVAALTKALSDMDDMDDALFASSLRNRKSSTLKSEQSVEAAKNSGNDRELAGTRTLSPPSLMNTADSKRRTFTIKEEESSPDIGSKASGKSQPAGKKPLTKSFDFGEFDEDDPLAGLLSDEEEPAPKKASVQRTARTQSKEDTSRISEDVDLDSPKKSSPLAKRSTSLNRGGTPEKDTEEQSITRAKSAPPPKRNDDVDFGEDDILDTMGFDDSPPQAKKSEKKEDEEIRAAKSKVADLFGKKPAASPPDKPPAGRAKEFVLDAKYRRHERGKPQKELDEEDFSFGSYTPSAVNTLKRPDSAPPGRRSVRFADDVDDLFGGTSTLGRPSGGAGRQRSTSQAVAPSDRGTGRTHSDVKGQGGDDGDWLSLAIGKSNERKEAEQKEALKSTLSKKEKMIQEEEKKEDKTKNVVMDQKKDTLRGESEEDWVDESKKPQKAETPREASAGDYLGLGEDIDLDTLLSSSKPASRLGNSRRRDTRSSFPWDDDVNEMNTTADLGSTMDSKLLGETMSTEEDGDSRSSSLIARQVAELEKMEELEQSKKMSMGNDSSILDGRNSQPDNFHQTPAPSPEANKQGSRLRSDIPQAKPQAVANTFIGSSPPVAGIVPNQEQGRKVSEDTGGIDRTAVVPPKQSQSAIPGVKREPQWRQELRKRQELMQTQTSEQPYPPQEPPQRASIGSTPALAATIPEESTGFQAPPAPSLPVKSDLKEPSVSQWQNQLIKQQQQAENFEKVMREQQEHLKAQQEEQLKQMQKMQQEAMQQQLQMQQQMLQAQTVTSLPQMMSFPGHSFQNSFRPPGYESKIHQLEEEKRFLEMSLQSLQDQHKQQLSAKDTAHQDYIHLLEDSFKKKEERLILEQEEQKKRFEERLQEIASERGKIMTEHYQRIQEIQADHLQQRNIINQGHMQELESMRDKQQKDLEQVRASMQEELKAMNEVTGHSRSLQAVVDQVGVVGQELGSLQTKISGEHQQRLERQQTELQQKDQQLQVLQKNLEHQQEEMSAERSRLESMIQRLEAQIRQQNTQLDEERWRLRQEQNKLSSFQKALEEERKIAAEQTAAQQVSLQQARESLTAEQQSNIAQCMEERKALAAERAQIVTERKELEATIKQQMEKIARENAEREGRLHALMEDEKKISLELENVERQREEQKREKEKLLKERMEMNKEQEKLQEMAERLRLRAQQIEEAVEDAVQVRQEGVNALENAQKIESEQAWREQGILEQQQALKAMERQISQERLKQAEEESRIERLISDGLCPSCARSITGVKGNREVFLPITARPVSDKYMARNQQTYPSPLLSRKEDLVDHLLSKAEFDHTVRVWRIAANKDKDFLEEETSFLNSLRIQSQS